MQTERLITQLIQKVEAINFIVSKQQELIFPSDRPLRLAYVISKVATLIKEEITKQYTSGINRSSQEAFDNQIKFAIGALHNMGEHLRFVDRATTRQTPWSLIRPLEKVGEAIHSECCFVIRPQWSYNYSIRELVPIYRNWFSAWLPNDLLEEALKLSPDDTVKRLYIMGFPYVERLNVLMHTIFGHEIGHPIEKEYFQSEDTPQVIENITQAVLKTRSLPTDIQTLDIFTTGEVVRMCERVVQLRHRALAEVTCDLVAVHLFGPAALFAIEEIALGREPDRFDTTDTRSHYPPWRYRLRTVVAEFIPEWVDRFITIGGFDPSVSKTIQDRFTNLRAFTESSEDTDLLSKNQEAKIAYHSLEAALPGVRKFVKERLANCGFNMDDVISSSNAPLLERLNNWVPPDAYINAVGEEVVGDVRLILNVGWIRWLHSYSYINAEFDDEAAIRSHLKQVNALERLVLKALEYVDLRSLWGKRPTDGES